MLNRLAAYHARSVDIDGCVYREGLQAVRIAGGVAGNVVPDAAELDVNFRFAPDRSVDEAVEHVREVVDGLDLGFEVTDSSPGALPGLAQPRPLPLIEAAGGQFRAKYGWTDVSRFSALGIPAVNYGPGDPNLAHKRDERVPVEQITATSTRGAAGATSPPDSLNADDTASSESRAVREQIGSEKLRANTRDPSYFAASKHRDVHADRTTARRTRIAAIGCTPDTLARAAHPERVRRRFRRSGRGAARGDGVRFGPHTRRPSRVRAGA